MSNTVRLAELPLLGSNQDSPDPESAVVGRIAGETAASAGRNAPETPEATHEIPHGFTHRAGRLLGKQEQIDFEFSRLCAAFGHRCAYCGSAPSLLFREHMFPKGRGGGDEIENIVPACCRCNTVKGSRTPLEWFLTKDEKRPQRPRRVWPTSDVPCLRCHGPSERRRYSAHGRFYDRCPKCRIENSHVPQMWPAGSLSPDAQATTERDQ